jgi:outer membrane lipoprotein-sorting protein
MKSSLYRICAIAFSILVLAAWAAADEGPLDKSEPKGSTPEEIIKRFAAKEKEFKEARDLYTYRQDVKVQTLDGNTVDGEYRQVFDITFDDQGHKSKNVVFAPQATLTRIGMSQEDVDDIENRLPFVLTSDEVSEYNILYVGMQQEDELHCYVFDIAPKEIVGKKRYFQGRIWVDDTDFQVVKTFGKTVPDIRKKKGNENLFPSFTTWRQRIDGKYWFPVYTKADDTLHFSGGLGDVHIVEVVKYQNYKRFGSRTRITYEGKELPPGGKKEPDSGQQQQQQPQK